MSSPGYIWGRRGIARDEGEVLVLRPTPAYRLLGLFALLVGLGIALYFSLLFAVARQLAVVLVLGIFWAFGALLLWAGAMMLTDPWLISFQRRPPLIRIVEKRALPFAQRRRSIPLQEVEAITLRRGLRSGIMGGTPFYALELVLSNQERIEIDYGGAMWKERLCELAERIQEFTGKPMVEGSSSTWDPKADDEREPGER